MTRHMYSYYITHLPTGITQQILVSSNKISITNDINTIFIDIYYNEFKPWVNKGFHYLRKYIWQHTGIWLSNKELTEQCEISVRNQEYE